MKYTLRTVDMNEDVFSATRHFFKKGKINLHLFPTQRYLPFYTITQGICQNYNVAIQKIVAQKAYTQRSGSTYRTRAGESEECLIARFLARIFTSAHIHVQESSPVSERIVERLIAAVCYGFMRPCYFSVLSPVKFI